jgi:aryl sulfotransferase
MAGAALARSGRHGESCVTRTIWLASYPKSGNTWLRILIANALSKEGEPVDINNIPVGDMPCHRARFDYVTLLDSGLLTHDEIDVLRPRIYAQFARDRCAQQSKCVDTPRVRFEKVHDACAFNSAGEPLLGGAHSAAGAVIIVRDPRDVAPSLAHHLNRSIDKSIAFMNDDEAALAKRTNRQGLQLRQRLRGWSEHVASWLDQTDIAVYLVRYEDLRRDTAGELLRVMEFVGVPVAEEAVNRAVVFSDFAQLQRQEQKSGFSEAPVKGARFFRRGEMGNWLNELSREQVARIESHHGRMMCRLGYELSFASELACAG